MSFIVGQNGGVDLLQTIRRMPVMQFFRDIRNLPVDRYDLVVSDFEPVSAWACQLHRKPCIGLSHQNAVLHPSAPKPEITDWLGKLILRKYAPATFNYGFNFRPASPSVFPPVIRSDIRNAEPTVKSHFTVYLPSFSDQQIHAVLSLFQDTEWQVFSKHSKHAYTSGNISFQPVSLEKFTESFLHCTGLICTAGFEGPAEAIFMGKKLCVIPMKNQYEQYCNAAFLKSMGILVLDQFTFRNSQLEEWVKSTSPLQIDYPDQTREILQQIIERHGYC
jgi:uncharacterized protein (TIGR00661 family)